MEEPTCPPTPPLSKCPDTPPRAGSSKTSPSRWDDSPDNKEKSSASSPNRPSSPVNCAICLGPLTNKSFTNSCCHQFCFVCLLEWSKVKAECPLCKVEFDSIIHNVRSQDDYDQYHIVRQPPPRPPSIHSLWNSAREQYQYRAFSEWMANRGLSARGRSPYGLSRLIQDAIPAGPPTRLRPRRGPIFTGTSVYRRLIYDRDMWARMQPDVTGRYRECSPEFYSQNPAQLHRLIPFLNRELNVLLENGGRTAYVMEKILELLPRYSITSSMFRSRVSRLIGPQHTPHFCHELRAFASSPFDLAGYDRAVEYTGNGGAGYSIEIEDDLSDNNTRSDDGDDIQIIEPTTEPSSSRNNPSTSTSAQASNVAAPLSPLRTSLSNSAVVNVSSDSESDTTEDVQIVGFVKPRHERTPEIITLSSPEHPSISSMHSPAQTLSPPNSCNDLICISLGHTSTAEHTWQDNVNELSSDEGTPRLQLRSSRSVNYLEPISSTDSFDSSSSSDNKKKRKHSKHRHSKRGSKSKGRKYSKSKHSRKRCSLSSDSEDDISQPSTSKGHSSKRKDSKSSVPSLRLRISKKEHPSRNATYTAAAVYTDSDTDSDAPSRAVIRSAIVAKTYNPPSSDNESGLENNSTQCISSNRVRGEEKLRISENNVDERLHKHNAKQSRPHSSMSPSSNGDSSPYYHKKFLAVHGPGTSRSKKSHKTEKKHGSRSKSKSPETYTKRLKKRRKSPACSDDDFQSKKAKKRHKLPVYSDDSDYS